MFWILTGALALVLTLLLLIALLRGNRDTGPAEAFDLQVYRDQLREIEKDAARGSIPEDEAARLKIEISRRILAADAAAQKGSEEAGKAGVASYVMGALVAATILGGGFALYMKLGQPGTPDQPLTQRLAEAQQLRDNRMSQEEAEAKIPAQAPVQAPDEYMKLVEQLREAVEERPDDVRGLTLLAGSEANLGNYRRSYELQKKIAELLGDKAGAKTFTDIADMMIIAAGGYVSPEAQVELEKALALDPNDGVARFYGGLLMAQTGRPDIAFQIWDRLLRASRPDAPWVGPIRAQIEELAFRAGVTRYQLPPLPESHDAPSGPSADDVAAAAEMTPEERQEMIRGMVEGLSTRLAEEGGPASDWARLIGALAVLGEQDRAKAIYGEARTVFAEKPELLKQIDAAANRAGLTSE
ncbi:c-type cytochrome biogenesis protein CcmI [Tropicibacter sp. R15_0]|uniref:c-type cytochrome biogenesis protein CcmI n=1 Tax=Tropicibacter sp. R15_0 TaxID=2821101 RepID=UPI001AD9F531|nr:c-type cytochrome biogenesis protein CcmI [Tropicibacter sp. R15_0]MBO9464983.1 c-type cytochrome biogenesis protein CcmI [Tropicibacter sp. R15_0]